MSKQPLVIYGNGEQSRDFIYVTDVVRAFILAAETDYNLTQILNVCTGRSISINYLAQTMLKVYKSKVPIIYKDGRIGDILHSKGNPAEAKRMLSFESKIYINEGLKLFKSN